MSEPVRPSPRPRRSAPDPEAATGTRSTAVAEVEDDVAPAVPGAEPEESRGPRLRRRGRRAAVHPQDQAPTDEPTDDVADDGDDAPARQRRRISVPLVPVLAVLLVLLLGLNAWLLWPRVFGDDESSVRTGTYVAALQAARSDVVDLTSFDYLTIDDDIEQARRVTTGDLTDEAVQGLQDARQQLVDGQAVVSTEVVGAGVTRATGSEATVVMVIATTRQAAGVAAQVSRSRIEVDLQKEGDRWLLSAIRGTGPDD